MRFHITRHQCLCHYVSRPPFHLFLGELRSAGAGFGGCARRLVSFNNSTTNFRFTPDDSELYSVMSKKRDEISFGLFDPIRWETETLKDVVRTVVGRAQKCMVYK